MTGFGNSQLMELDRLVRKTGILYSDLLAMPIGDLVLNLTMSRRADRLLEKRIGIKRDMDTGEVLFAILNRLGH